ncbi:hypothetical protein [Leucobacter komagatae]|uniref:hypothetical protein n=1 Tax=Leucobacter komagatae TaxID=55969 RepID=UPI001153C5CB|nr:hypothetical protein [Leucobacter komagatae]
MSTRKVHFGWMFNAEEDQYNKGGQEPIELPGSRAGCGAGRGGTVMLSFDHDAITCARCRSQLEAVRRERDARRRAVWPKRQPNIDADSPHATGAL